MAETWHLTSNDWKKSGLVCQMFHSVSILQLFYNSTVQYFTTFFIYFILQLNLFVLHCYIVIITFIMFTGTLVFALIREAFVFINTNLKSAAG